MNLDPIQVPSVLFTTCIDFGRSDGVLLMILVGGVVAVLWCGIRIASLATALIGALVQALASVSSALLVTATALCMVAAAMLLAG